MVKIFDELKTKFNEHGFHLYMIGSTSRDYLINKKIEDFDFVTDALPEEVAEFLEVDLTFKKFGVVKTKIDGNHIDIATLREESTYLDARHPDKIKFIKDPSLDYKRRDFTINAIYIDENYNVLPISEDGVKDLKEKRLVFIGDPLVRIKEDPLRILRAIRFIKQYDLSIDEKTYKILVDNLPLIDKLNKDKVTEEKKKFQKATGGEDYEFFTTKCIKLY